MAQIVTQPMAGQPPVQWHTDIFECCEDASTCCYGFWCCPCLACTVSAQLGENRCFPLCDICSTAILIALGIPLCVPPAVLALRAGMRNKYGIMGSSCSDIQDAWCCFWCSWCQMHRELKHRKKPSTVVVMQNQTIVQMQPAPVTAPPAYQPQAGFMHQPEAAMASYTVKPR